MCSMTTERILQLETEEAGEQEKTYRCPGKRPLMMTTCGGECLLGETVPDGTAGTWVAAMVGCKAREIREMR